MPFKIKLVYNQNNEYFGKHNKYIEYFETQKVWFHGNGFECTDGFDVQGNPIGVSFDYEFYDEVYVDGELIYSKMTRRVNG